ncbi:MAG: family 20 glycosylhydrolase [Planctomycetia bacterium]|nr:family 20 glycosylhydrolase [Planctomycetia bacterium]
MKQLDRPWPSRFQVEVQANVSDSLVKRFAEAPSGSGPEFPLLLTNDCEPIALNGYMLCLEPGRVICAAASEAGLRYGLQSLRQLATEPNMPMGAVDDAPAMRVRGFHLNFESYRRMDMDAALRLVDAAARFKLNSLLVEYGPRFPFSDQPQMRDGLTLSPEEIARLTSAAAGEGIEVIPLQQSLAHLEYLLKHDCFAHLRERDGRVNMLCPTHEESLPLIKSLMSEVMALHPASRWFHLGGDEARKIGECPRCRPLVKKEGVGPVYGRFMGELARWVLAQGKRPIVWDDTFSAHPDALNHLPKETIIQYWDYIVVDDPTPVLIPRMSHAQYGGPRVCHDWSWIVPGRTKKLSDVQRGVMRNYSKAARLKSALGRAYMAEFGKYLGDDFPGLIRALPYVEYYQDRGFDVITSPTGMGNGDMKDGTPNFARFERNISTHGRRAKENGKTLGVITTAWYDMPPEILHQPLVQTAMSTW